MAKLALPDGVRTKVFRKVVQLLQSDLILKRTIRPDSWYVWTGKPTDKAGAFATGELPALRLTPIALGASPETNVRQNSPLGLHFEVATDTTNIDDAMNLWEAVEAVFFPGDGPRASLTALQTVYSGVVSIRLSSPSFTPMEGSEKDDMIIASGDLTIEMMVKR